MAKVAQLVVLAILAMMVGSLVGCGGCDREAVGKECQKQPMTDCTSCGEAVGKCCDEKNLEVSPGQSAAQNELTGKGWFELAKTSDSPCKTRDTCS